MRAQGLTEGVNEGNNGEVTAAQDTKKSAKH